MGRFVVRGRGALPFLQRVLTGNAAALVPGRAQYSADPRCSGAAIDDAYLYRLGPDDYLLVVNAANRATDWGHLQDSRRISRASTWTTAPTRSPRSPSRVPVPPHPARALQAGARLPEPGRNNLRASKLGDVDGHRPDRVYRRAPGLRTLRPGRRVRRGLGPAREPGASPAGLGARDTLCLEQPSPSSVTSWAWTRRRPIPIFSCPLARLAVSSRAPWRETSSAGRRWRGSPAAFRRTMLPRLQSIATSCPGVIKSLPAPPPGKGTPGRPGLRG